MARKVSGKVSTKRHSFTRMVPTMVSPKNAKLNIQPARKNWLSRMVSTAMVRGKVRTVSSQVSIKSVVANSQVNSLVNSKSKVRMKGYFISVQFRHESERQNLYASMDCVPLWTHIGTITEHVCRKQTIY